MEAEKDRVTPRPTDLDRRQGYLGEQDPEMKKGGGGLYQERARPHTRRRPQTPCD